MCITHNVKPNACNSTLIQCVCLLNCLRHTLYKQIFLKYENVAARTDWIYDFLLLRSNVVRYVCTVFIRFIVCMIFVWSFGSMLNFYGCVNKLNAIAQTIVGSVNYGYMCRLSSPSPSLSLCVDIGSITPLDLVRWHHWHCMFIYIETKIPYPKSIVHSFFGIFQLLGIDFGKFFVRIQ